MNPNDIESRLERSLRNQVKAPRLGKRFDAGVWARIEAESAQAPLPARRASNWLFVLNGIGAGVALLLVVVFGAQTLFGIEGSVSLPSVDIDAATINAIVKASGNWFSLGALALGISLTPLGRRMRAGLREYF
jgi:hypothetical protein